MTDNPRVWKVSKCEDMLMGDFGLMRLTFVQEAFNNAIDFVDYNAKNPDGTKDVPFRKIHHRGHAAESPSAPRRPIQLCR